MNHDFTRIKRLPPYVFNITGALKMAARHRGEDIIDFSMGNPDGPTPKHIVDKMIEVAQRQDTHGYSASKGIPRLRKAICNWYRRKFDVELDPESEAIMTIGSKEGIAHLMLACTDRGDTVIVPNPSYPIHLYGAIIAGADIRSVKMIPGVDFFEELERVILETVPRPKMVLLSFPSNPTAQCVDLDFFKKVIKLAKKYGVWVVHDLAYADICFDDYKVPSIMQVPGAKDIAVEFFTMSKSYNMAGWRIGFMVGNKELVNALARIKSYHDYGTFTPLQVAAIEALEGPQDCVEEVRMKYQRRRDLLVKSLNEIGWPVEKPKASMYIWARIPEPYRKMGSVEFSKHLLEDAKVAVSPGIGFGEYGDDHVRIALIENEDRSRQAVRNIKQMFRIDGLIDPDLPRNPDGTPKQVKAASEKKTAAKKSSRKQEKKAATSKKAVAVKAGKTEARKAAVKKAAAPKKSTAVKAGKTVKAAKPASAGKAAKAAKVAKGKAAPAAAKSKAAVKGKAPAKAKAVAKKPGAATKAPAKKTATKKAGK